MFCKYAKADVLEVRSAPSQVRSASLSKFADFNDYKTADGFIYVRVRAISSRVNKNHDGWPSEELKKSYRSFVGKPLFVDHHNSDPKRARGVVVDAQLHVEDLDKVSSFDPYYSTAPDNHKPPTWIELLLEVDAKRFPKLAKAIINGEIDSVSMGANVERTRCSHCQNWASTPEEYCAHVRSKGAHFDFIDQLGQKTSKRAYEDCYGIGFFENSFVFDPADETAHHLDVRTAKIEEIMDEDNERYGAAPEEIDQNDPGYAFLIHDAQAAFDRAFTHTGGQSGESQGFLAAKRAVEQAGYPNLAFGIANDIKNRHLSLIQRSMDNAQGYDPSIDDVGDTLTWSDAPPGIVERGTMNNAIWSSIRESNQYIEKRGDKWVITQKGTGKVLSEHDSEEKANASFAAMEMSKHHGSVVSRFMKHVSMQDGDNPCWEWVGGSYNTGYGRFNFGGSGKSSLAHRVAYEIWKGEIPKGLVVAHSCDNPRCVNPDHLQAMTQADNVQDMVVKGWHHNGKKTHCVHGHEFTEENTYIRPNGNRDCMTCRTARDNARIADRRNPEPQADMTMAPHKVNTLRQDQLCPICGSDMEDGVCEVCNYEEPPEGFDNPDLEQAQEVDQQVRQQDAQQSAQTPPTAPPAQGQLPQSPAPAGAAPQGLPMAASTEKTKTSAPVTSEKTAAQRPITQVRPILPVTRKLSDKPLNVQVKQDATSPKESSTRKDNMTDIRKTADGATADGGSDVQPTRRVDVIGVGGVSGDPEAETQHENVEKAMPQDGGPPTDTWSGGEGDSLGQHEPVSGEPTIFDLGGPIGAPVSHVQRTADDSASSDLGGPIGEPVGQGTADKGGPVWDASDTGFPDHQPSRVDLFAPLKEEIGESTETDTNEEFRSLKHTEPVTQEGANNLGGPMGTGVNAPMKEHHPSIDSISYSHAIKAMKLAETEVAIGYITEDEKFNRVAALEGASAAEIDAAQGAYDRARTAMAKKASVAKTANAHRLPSFSMRSSVEPIIEVAGGWNPEDSLY